MVKQSTSIYDFIYLDIDRIHSYYAQLTDGVPNQKKSSKNKSGNINSGVNGGLPDIAQINGSIEATMGTVNEQSMDMYHVLPRDMIEKLDAQNLISKNLATNNLGTLILVEGLINFLDFDTLSQTSDTALNLQKERKEKEGSFNQDTYNSSKRVMDLIKTYPVDVLATMQIKKTTTQHAWMVLDKKYLTSAHLISSLKHQPFSSEEFFVLGILDAIPDKFSKNNNDDMESFEAMLKSSNPFNGSLFAMASMYKDFIGRPENFFGITPISIYRIMKAKKA